MKIQSIALYLLGGAPVGIASAAAPASSGPPTADPVVPGAYIVELHDDHDVASFYSDLRASNLEVDPRLDLSHPLFNGCSFRLRDTSSNHANVAAKISDMSKVRKIWPVRQRRISSSVVSVTSDDKVDGLNLEKRGKHENDTFSPHVMTQVDKLHAKSITGVDVRIGIVDTGVDYNHPALGGCFGDECLVSYGADLVGDNFTGFNDPVPDKDPHDACNGHGTHLAGIIAAQRNEFGFTGAAPDATLGMYRAYGCNGESSDDVQIAAVKQAYVDGSDIILASLGGSSGWAEDPRTIVVSRIVEAGVPCVAAIGDNGPQGPFSGDTPANGKGVTAVGSFDNTEIPLIYLGGNYTVGNSSNETTYGWWSGSPAFTNLSLPLWAADAHVDGSAVPCHPLPDSTPDLSGYLVLLSQTTYCSYETLATNVAAKGAKYIMFFTTIAEKADVSSVKGIVGVGSTRDEVGEQWCSLLQNGTKVTVKVTEPDHTKKIVEYILPQWGRFQTSAASYDTSWGPTWELDVKPQVAAPGNNILSTYPVELGGYAVLGGTSTAAAITAAVYALVAQVRRTHDPSLLERVLSSTANPSIFPYVMPDGTLAILAPVAQQGGGLIQAFDAAYTTTIPSVASISFNDTDNFIPSADFSIENVGSEEVTYELGHVFALTTDALVGVGHYVNNAKTVVYANATLQFSVSKFTVPAGGSVNITVTPKPPSGLNETLLPMYSGYITVNGTNNDSLSIPYLGVVGSMHSSARVLDPNGTFLANSSDPETPILDDPVFTVPHPANMTIVPDNKTGYPTVVVQLNTGTPLLECSVRIYEGQSGSDLNLTTTKSIIPGVNDTLMEVPFDYSQRLKYVSPFTGVLGHAFMVPAGQYLFQVRALRIFGDPGKDEDFDSITLGPFIIEYD
ncbi:subtilisin-like protein [Hypoxylon sp. FL1857]|nr:subtilisin-like protein [Hypoxylon sp. FL1857]